jgi:hypothetical protein
MGTGSSGDLLLPSTESSDLCGSFTSSVSFDSPSLLPPVVVSGSGDSSGTRSFRRAGEDEKSLVEMVATGCWRGHSDGHLDLDIIFWRLTGRKMESDLRGTRGAHGWFRSAALQGELDPRSMFPPTRSIGRD